MFQETNKKNWKIPWLKNNLLLEKALIWGVVVVKHYVVYFVTETKVTVV